MAFVQYLLLYVARNMGLLLVDPIFYLLAIAVVYLYKRQGKNLQGTIDEKRYMKQSIINIAIGTGIGLTSSGILSYFGINFVIQENILWLIPIAIVLMFINPKYGCFSYVVALAYLIEGVLQLMTSVRFHLNYEILALLVGALHILEGCLVMLSGHKNPVQIMLYKQSKICTKTALNQIWLVPIIFVTQTTTIPLPLYALLAYGDLAPKHQERKQSLFTGSLILIYGLIMVFLTYTVIDNNFSIGAVIMLMPVLHELIFVVSQNK